MKAAMTAAICVMAVSGAPALAQTATATGTGVGVSNSESRSGAVAISGQGGRGGNSSLTINNPAETTSNVNQKISGETTSNVNSRVSGTTTSNVVTSGTTTIKNVPTAIAPGLSSAGLETCLGSASGGVSAVGFGVSGGSTYKDEDCTARLDSRTLFAMGLKAAAVARLCQRADIWRSMPDICTKYWPVGQPYPTGIATPVGYVGPAPLIAPRPILAPNYGYEQPYAMGGTSMEVVDGKTGLTRPCDDYNAVRQKCMNWADGPKKNTKLAAAKPAKRKTIAVTPNPANVAAAPTAEETKKE